MDATGEREVMVMSLERDDGDDDGDEQRRKRTGGRGGAVAVRVVVVVVVAARRAALFLAAGARLRDGELEAVGFGICGGPEHGRVPAEPVGAEVLGRRPRVDAVGA